MIASPYPTPDFGTTTFAINAAETLTDDAQCVEVLMTITDTVATQNSWAGDQETWLDPRDPECRQILHAMLDQYLDGIAALLSI